MPVEGKQVQKPHDVTAFVVLEEQQEGQCDWNK